MNASHESITCKKILVTDDDPDELFATSRILNKAGYVVEEAGSAKEAIDKAIKTRPDLILLDVVMPEMDGFEACQHIKSDHRLSDIFVVLLSNIKKTPEYKAKGLDAGADGFISRPFDTKEFLSRIGAIMRIKAIEKELRMQRQWLRITLSSIGDGLIATDKTGRVLFMNPMAEKITGWTAEEAKLRDIKEIFNIVDDATLQPIKGPIGKVLEEGSILQLGDNVLLIGKNQDRIPIADSASPIRNGDGKIIGGVLVFRDITEKKLSEQKTNQALMEWGVMFKAIGQMALIIDPHHGILDANDVALQKTGLTRDQIIGKKCFEIIHGKTRPPEDCPMVKALRSRRQESSAIRVEKIEGDYFVSCTPVLDSRGKIDKVIHIATDISELKKAEKGIQESENKYLTLFKSSSDAVLLTDVETLKILDANDSASKMYGYSHDELIHLTATDLSNEKEKTIKALQVDFQNEILVRYQRKKDGTVFPVEITQNFLTLGNRKTVLVSIRDISKRLKYEEERKALETHLRQAQKMEAIGTLSSGIAHDFNNILTSIIGYSELSLQIVEKDSKLEGFLQEIYAAGNRAKDMVKQILTFSRQGDENFKPVQIDLIVKEVAKFLRSSVPSTIAISHNVDGECLVFADPTQIHQVLMNLCTNSAHAMGKSGGRLEINLSKTTLDERHKIHFPDLKPGKYVRMTVSDTGVGIPKEHIESIFEPYFTTKAPGEGTGLGLAMVHGIVKRHNGCITAQSNVGKGTSFDIYLPLTDKPKIAGHRAKENLPTGNERILFVDDERPIAKMGGQIIEKLGYKVVTRTSSIEALELFRSNPNGFDLVITDMTMPNMTGDKLAIELVKIRSDIPVILCTGYSQRIPDEPDFATGIKAFAFKPIATPDLARIIRKVLDESKGA
jgi:PAS domain S-box-containing protein